MLGLNDLDLYSSLAAFEPTNGTYEEIDSGAMAAEALTGLSDHWLRA